MEVSKFKIGNNIIDVKDAQARDDVVAAMNAAQDAQSTADMKLNAADAWKIGQTSLTVEHVTIASGANYSFVAPKPEGASSIIILYARSADRERTLVPINLYVGNNLNAIMSNQGATAYTNETMTIQFTYAYK